MYLYKSLKSEQLERLQQNLNWFPQKTRPQKSGVVPSDREEISCIKSLLKTQKDSIIQDFTLEAEHMKKELVQEMENFKMKGLSPSEPSLEVKLLRAELEQEKKISKRTRSVKWKSSEFSGYNTWPERFLPTDL